MSHLTLRREHSNPSNSSKTKRRSFRESDSALNLPWFQTLQNKRKSVGQQLLRYGFGNLDHPDNGRAVKTGNDSQEGIFRLWGRFAVCWIRITTIARMRGGFFVGLLGQCVINKIKIEINFEQIFILIVCTLLQQDFQFCLLWLVNIGDLKALHGEV